MPNLKEIPVPQQHSPAWVIQAWAAFVISITATTIGVLNLPADGANSWVKGYLGMGLLFTVASTFSLGKQSETSTRLAKFRPE